MSVAQYDTEWIDRVVQVVHGVLCVCVCVCVCVLFAVLRLRGTGTGALLVHALLALFNHTHALSLHAVSRPPDLTFRRSRARHTAAS